MQYVGQRDIKNLKPYQLQTLAELSKFCMCAWVLTYRVESSRHETYYYGGIFVFRTNGKKSLSHMYMLEAKYLATPALNLKGISTFKNAEQRTYQNTLKLTTEC